MGLDRACRDCNPRFTGLSRVVNVGRANWLRIIPALAVVLFMVACSEALRWAPEYYEVRPGDTVYSVTQRCYTSMLPLFCEVMTQWLTSGTLPTSTEAWGREAYRRSELNALCRVTPSMDKDEIRRRVKATTYPGAPGAYVELAGIRFVAPETATEEKMAI